MKKKVWIWVIAVIILVGGIGAGVYTYSQKDRIKLDPENPLVLTLWHYYNGQQQEQMDAMIEEFNSTKGKEEGIVIQARNWGSVGDLGDAVITASEQTVGASELPDLFLAYADTAYLINEKGYVANLKPYISDKELEEYMDAYVNEGYIYGSDELKIFPVAKSTEILLINETDWAKFESATGADKSKFETWEGIVELAKQYYEWTDAQTPDVPNDGKAMFGRDAFANYILIGSMQLGKEMFKVDDGKVTLQIQDDIMKRLWDCYYVPYVNGWFGAYGKFRSDDIKTGQIISLVGSSSGALYFPNEVTLDDGTTYPIDCGAYVLPNFEGTKPYAVQQGAGFVVTKGTKEKEYAACEFLKWFTDTENNMSFAVDSGYLPVKKEANDIDKLNQFMDTKNVNNILRSIVEIGATTANTYTLYTNKAFKNGTKARKVAECNMVDAANAAVEERDKMIKSGVSREDAVAKLTSEEAFQSWLADFKTQMEDANKE